MNSISTLGTENEIFRSDHRSVYNDGEGERERTVNSKEVELESNGSGIERNDGGELVVIISKR